MQIPFQSIKLALICALFLTAAGATSQQANPEVFKGRWQLIDYQQQDDSGQWQWLNVDRKGFILYDGIGGMGVHQVTKDYDTYEIQGTGRRENLTGNDLEHLAGNFVYFGRYRIDRDNGIIEHHIESHSNPQNWGTIAKRYYTFSGDTLFLQPVDREPALRIVWQRLRDTEGVADHISYADSTTARNLLTTEDDFTRSWSAFDINARLHKTDGTRDELFALITDQIVEWTAAEKALIDKSIQSIQSNLDTLGIVLELPETIHLVKTTCAEEGSAVAYTRGNYIVFQDGLDFSDEWNVSRLMLHELFHVLSRNNPGFRRDMYDIIGFKPMNNVSYPESIAPMRITNPDAPQTDTYIKLNVGSDSVDCMIILYSNELYSGEGEFFDYLNIGFLALEGNDTKRPQLIDGKPVVYQIDEVSGFFDRIGNNTSYIIHPEEIMADNFSYTVTGKSGLPDPWIVEEVLKLLNR